MNIKSLLALTVVSLSTLTSTGHAHLTPEREAQLNDAARICATIATISNAATLAIPRNDIYITRNNQDAFRNLSLLLNRLYEMFYASLEGSSNSNSIMRINRCLEVLVNMNPDEPGAFPVYFMAWIKDMNIEKAKKIAIGLVNFALKEVIYDQTGKIVTANVIGADTNKRLMRRGIRILTNVLVESLLDTAEAWAKNKTLEEKRHALVLDYTTDFCITAIKTAIIATLDQIIGEFIRRGYETNTEEARQLNEAVKAIEPAASTESCQ